MRWAFWHAEAQSDVAVSDRALKWAEQREWDSWLRAVSLMTPSESYESMVEWILARAPHPTDVKNARDLYQESVAYESACAHVLELLKRRKVAKPRPAVRPALRSA